MKCSFSILCFLCIYSVSLFFPLTGFSEQPGFSRTSLPDIHFSSDTLGENDNSCTDIKEMPRFKKGNIREWVRKQTHYDTSKGLYKKIYVQFYIEADGSVSNPQILHSTNDPLEKEALKIIGKMGNWKPGRQNDKPVRISYILPVEFDRSRITVQPAPQWSMALSKENLYRSDLKTLEEQEKIYNKQISLPEKYKKNIGDKEYAGQTDSAAHRQYLQKLKEEKNRVLEKAQQALKSLIFTIEERDAIIKAIETEYDQDFQWTESHGPENFIQNYGNRTHWEAIQTNLRSRMEIKRILTPEKHKEFMIARMPAMKSPVFPAGSPQAWIARHVKYPGDAFRSGAQGKVYVGFIIEKDGKISEIKILRSSGHRSLDQAACEVVKTMPAWQPGTVDGIPARISYTLPVSFRLSK